MIDMRRFYTGLCRAEAIVAGVFLISMVVLIFAGGIARLAAHPINWAMDISTFLFAWACFLCGNIAWRNDSLMSIDLVTDRLPSRLQLALAYANYALIFLFLVFLAYFGFRLSWISASRSFQGLPWISYSFVTASLPVCACLLMVTLAVKVRRLRRDGLGARHGAA